MTTNQARYQATNRIYQKMVQTHGWDHPVTLRWEALDMLATEAYMAAPEAPATLDPEDPEISAKVAAYVTEAQGQVVVR